MIHSDSTRIEYQLGDEDDLEEDSLWLISRKTQSCSSRALEIPEPSTQYVGKTGGCEGKCAPACDSCSQTYPIVVS